MIRLSYVILELVRFGASCSVALFGMNGNTYGRNGSRTGAQTCDLDTIVIITCSSNAVTPGAWDTMEDKSALTPYENRK